jgi:hypothetical protein
MLAMLLRLKELRRGTDASVPFRKKSGPHNPRARPTRSLIFSHLPALFERSEEPRPVMATEMPRFSTRRTRWSAASSPLRRRSWARVFRRRRIDGPVSGSRSPLARFWRNHRQGARLAFGGLSPAGFSFPAVVALAEATGTVSARRAFRARRPRREAGLHGVEPVGGATPPWAFIHLRPAPNRRVSMKP